MKAQDTSVEKSLFGIQTGFWGFWGYHEARLDPKWALRTEVGIFDYFGLAEGLHFEPILTLEPRWYYNRKNRLEKAKRIDDNSGNFIAFKTSLRPDVFAIPVNTYQERKNLSISFVPTIGTRKNIGKKFNYELGFGLGIEYFSKGGAGFSIFADENPDDDKFGPAFNLHLRVGYKL
ncbi:hypothetical protein FGM00_18610 [Aggregatimonas sangjinii]|uniref:Outer membrane protein beta-barrel domain-containing protein n=1 Tax=Aggregatimonas sangjinii TaxID=2583587 RepID=A0A5B7SY72_9FLAO|nr:hypothetical protein [Aggregatimonas sangjinii]QCX02028.1 hypothetical protein FGM00_18610 [Aggregatimonas sangjinii]